MPIAVALRDLESCAHMVQFYASEAEYAVTVGTYVLDALSAKETAVALATDGHRAALETFLQERGVDHAAECASGNLVWGNAAHTLQQILVDGWPDPQAFDQVVGSLMRECMAKGRPTRAFGELVALLWEQGDALAAIELEALWNELGRQLTFSLLCAYPSDAPVPKEHYVEVIRLHAATREGLVNDWQLNGELQSFPANPQAPGQARRFVREVMESRGAHPDTVDKALVIVSELATNAVLHAESSFVVSLTFPPDGGVRLALRDDSRSLPAEPQAPGLREAGRGIALVEALSTRWSVDVHDNGKSVWAEIA